VNGRLLELELGDPYQNLALEEALFASGGPPTLRVWENQRSVVIGRAQLARFETDLDYCARNSVPVVRRFTAGGAVYNGEGNLNWSFFVPGGGGERGPWGLGDPGRVFESFAGTVAGALSRCGVECDYRPPNSIFDARGKICGMAAYVSRDAVLCHGTLLINAPLDEVQRLTKPAGREPPRRYPRSRFAVVSNCEVGRKEFVDALAGGGGNSFEPGEATEEELERARRLLLRYRSDSWNLGDPFGSDQP
jgi:lipoate---protein ligase